MLCGKRYDGGVTPKGGRYASTVVFIGCHRTCGRLLRYVTMRFDATGQYVFTRRIDRLPGLAKINAQCCNFAITDTDVGFKGCTGIGDGPASDQCVKCRHLSIPLQFF